MTRKIRLLVVDDEPDLVDIEREILEDCGYDVTTATSGEEARQLIAEYFFDLLILDERMKGMSGSQLLSESKERYPDIGAIFITGHADVEMAVQALYLGVLDFLQKPVANDVLVAAVVRALNLSQLARENRFLRYHTQARSTFADIIGEGEAMTEALGVVKQVIPTSVAVLLQGESGTGKELVSRAIHFHGPRKNKPFIPVNVAAIPPTLVESALFGHKKGAFTDARENKQGFFEASGGGTIFLDEIGDLSPEVQVKLLRVLQEKKIVRVGDVTEIPVDVRVISATNKNLKTEVEAGRFRKDLYYRLAVVTINLPPLRDRGEDIALLAVHLVEKNRKELGKHIIRIMPEAIEKLKYYSWPGNVRELDNVIQRAIILATGDTITPELLWLESDSSSTSSFSSIFDLPFKEAQLQFEMKYFSELLAKTAKNKTKAASLAGISRAVLYEHLEKTSLLDSK